MLVYDAGNVALINCNSFLTIHIKIQIWNSFAIVQPLFPGAKPKGNWRNLDQFSKTIGIAICRTGTPILSGMVEQVHDVCLLFNIHWLISHNVDR